MRSQIPSEIVKVLNYIERGILSKFNEDDIQLFYGDYRRRAELLKDVVHLIPKNAMILDAGSSPGFNSLALKMLGYDVISVDINPEPYKPLLERLGIKVIKVDLENESIPLNDESVDCVVFTEVLEHLHPYKISFTLSEINRTLKWGGYLYLTSPNICSIGKRIKLLLGHNPLGKMHVREYTIKEIRDMLNAHGFKPIREEFSLSYNITPHDAKDKDYKENLLKMTLRYPTKENIFHLLTLPLVTMIPSLRATIKIIGLKERLAKLHITYRRF